MNDINTHIVSNVIKFEAKGDKQALDLMDDLTAVLVKHVGNINLEMATLSVGIFFNNVFGAYNEFRDETGLEKMVDAKEMLDEIYRINKMAEESTT